MTSGTFWGLIIGSLVGSFVLPVDGFSHGALIGMAAGSIMDPASI